MRGTGPSQPRTGEPGIDVVEAFTESKSRTRPNEDTFVIGERHAAVIDGATDKSGIRYEWGNETVSSGRFAALVVAEAVALLDALPAPPGPHAAVARISERLDRAILAQQPGIGVRQRPSCSLVVYSAPHRQLWSVGDCSWAADGVQHKGGKEIDDITAGLRAAVTEAHLADGWAVEELADVDPGRAAIQGLLEHQGIFTNRSHALGYGAVNGTPVPDGFVEVHAMDAVGTLTLTSDGYPEILDTREASDRRLLELASADPLCIGPLRGPKAIAPGADFHDDRTWLSLRL